MGTIGSNTNSHLEKELGSRFPDGEHFVGFENTKNNICYANSVLQAFYYCQNFRKQIINYKPLINNFNSENPILIIQEIFNQIQFNKKKVGVISTKKLMNYVQKNNEMFREDYHHDTHEFLIWILNQINDTLTKQMSQYEQKEKTWLQKIFEGTITSQIKCFQCNNITMMNEPFLDLGIDIEENCSLFHCIKKFSHAEIMQDNDKFYCDKCQGLQNAEKKVMVKDLPETLIIHLKRFKYDKKIDRLVKLNWKIAFGLDLKIYIYDEKQCYYNLYAIIVHIGPGFQYGHYICIVKSQDRWYQFDDDHISLVDELSLSNIFGNINNSTCAYMLFYDKN